MYPPPINFSKGLDTYSDTFYLFQARGIRKVGVGSSILLWSVQKNIYWWSGKQVYSIDVDKVNYPFFIDLFRLQANCFLLLGCVNIPLQLVDFKRPNWESAQGHCDREIQLFNPFSLLCFTLISGTIFSDSPSPPPFSRERGWRE